MPCNAKFKQLLPKVHEVERLFRAGVVGDDQRDLIEPLMYELHDKVRIGRVIVEDDSTVTLINTYYNDCEALLAEIIKIIKN